MLAPIDNRVDIAVGMEDQPLNTQHEPHLQQILRPSGNYAFLNHSSTTLPNNLPPDVDDKLLARHKRRRTSPEDQAILEAAFAQDSKPDKTARLELVKRVALGEKEVQIWFQNRRQTSRRKSRPLLPHEIAQYQLSRSGWNYHSSQFDSTLGAGNEEFAQKAPVLTNATSNVDLEALATGIETTASSCINVETSLDLPTTSQASTAATSSTLGFVASSQSFASGGEGASFSTTPSQSDAAIGYLVNRRSVPSLRVDWPAENPEHISKEAVQTGSVYRLKKSSSVVRLSLSSEGNAQITTKDSSSPSPPRAPQISPTSAAGSYSGPPLSSASSHDASSFKSIQRSSSGRSRDSRAWEFWCDKDARSELEDKAEKDASGSAADAIDLLRSTTGRRVLGSLSTKRNSYMSRQLSSTKRARLNTTPSLLQRSNTSSGRLQNKPINSSISISNPVRKLKHSESAVAVHIRGNDSDKENWSPDSAQHSDAGVPNTRVSVDQRLLHHASARTEGDRGSLITLKSGGSFSSNEKDDPEADPELAAFMRGGRKSNSISEEEELDCVQNLLSLSQGNWR